MAAKLMFVCRYCRAMVKAGVKCSCGGHASRLETEAGPEYGKDKPTYTPTSIHGRPSDRPTIRDATEAATLVRPMFDGEMREKCVVILLDARHRVIDVATIAIGSLAGVEVHPREIFRAAINASAAAIILSHNHPSGDATPSQADIMLTDRIRDAGEIIGIPLLDHVVVSETGHASIAQVRR